MRFWFKKTYPQTLSKKASKLLKEKKSALLEAIEDERQENPKARSEIKVKRIGVGVGV